MQLNFTARETDSNAEHEAYCAGQRCMNKMLLTEWEWVAIFCAKPKGLAMKNYNKLTGWVAKNYVL